MTAPAYSTSPAADDRLLEVARLLAEGILRDRIRRFLKGNPAAGTREDSLELCAASSAHGPRNGEPA